MKKIFIDCGANEGQSIDNFMKTWVNWKEYDILSYEPNPNLSKYFDRFYNIKNITFNQKAVWIYDGTVDFYLSNSNSWGSSIISTKKTSQLSKVPITVECVDVDRIIRSYSEQSYIILKIDIEGAEYELLNYMLDKNTFELVNELYIEFHTDKVHKTEQDNKHLLNKLEQYNRLQVYHNVHNRLNFI